ncbi:MAG TPA: glucose-6-phosphate dehydrogenase [Thermoanaerobaculia bacterium]|jgi:glucose-6-phosphate 1-dehydrogenase|nr:glucose-6-phosphate dehydrogenase [Thermoanaerobaculia bacterium]
MTAPAEAQIPQQPQVQPAPPCVLVIFGATGDLTKRKLFPSLYNLAVQELLPKEFAVVGVSRVDISQDALRERLGEDLHEFVGAPVNQEIADHLLQHFYYVSGEFNDPATFTKLRDTLAHVDEESKTNGCYLFYLAVPPNLFGDVVHRLGDVGLAQQDNGHWRRVIIEKPFGHDLDSASELNRQILEVLTEKQIFRIDHYLGKETVQNIMALRFANGIFEPIWNRRYIDHVQITVAESVGVEDRGVYYEEAGALRDVLQNHVLQLLAFTAMEPPISFAADVVRDERVKVLHAIHPIRPEDVLTQAVRGQYAAGTIDGERVPAYRSEPHVSPTSTTETYAALKLTIDNWRWAGVPWYLRTGKRSPRRVTQIAVQFKRPPLMLFRETPIEQFKPNLLVIYVQPDEGVALRFEAKVPGPEMLLGTVKMDFEYADYFGSKPATGYESLLYDCMAGDSTLFHRSDIVDASWNIVTPVLDVWKTLPPRGFPNYAAGTWGPKEADEMLARDGCEWRNPRPQADRTG